MDLIHYHFHSIGSTNTWAKEHGNEFDVNALTLVTADEQTAGRGRFKRVWCSPPLVNIYATFCFFVGGDRFDLGHVPQLLALSTAKVLEQLAVKPALKWPNDILLSNKKVAGILCETVMIEERRCVVCGIGLNVNMAIEDLQKIDRPATSLLAETQQLHSTKFVLELMTDCFSNDLIHFLKNGYSAFFSDYQKRSWLKKEQEIRFHDNQHIVQGIFYSLNQDGSITLELEGGKLKTYYAGEFV